MVAICTSWSSSALGQLHDRAADVLTAAGLGFDSIAVDGTPRRLVLAVASAGVRETVREETVKGPPATAAFDKDGNPTRAAEGFARSNGVTVDQLTTEESGGRTYVVARKRVESRPALELLGESVERLFGGLRFGRSMYWETPEVTFSRPIRWLLALWGDEVVPATVGGVLSTNAGGNTTVRYGNARELMLGLEVVLPDGQIWNGLRRLRKDNTGYALRHLFVGAEGTLGIVTAATLRLFARPRANEVLFCSVRDEDAALNVFRRFREADETAIRAFEYMSGIGVDFAVKHIPGVTLPVAERADHYILVDLASTRADADLQGLAEQVLGAAMEEGEGLDAVIGGNEAKRQAIWRIREEHPEAQRKEGASVKNDVSVPVSRDLAAAYRGEGKRELGPIARQLKRDGKLVRAFDLGFLTRSDAIDPQAVGIWGALKGSILTMLVTLVLAFPVGVLAALYLEEYAPKNRWTDIIEVSINNLAAVPSIIFGLLGLAVFLAIFPHYRSAPLIGGMTLALMTMPVIVISGRNAIKAVPPSIRDAAFGIGASRVQTVFHHVLPLALPGILTGTIIGMARALGETAPLLMIGMRAFVATPPDGFTAPSSVLPVQIFLWSDEIDRGFIERTSAAIIVLLLFLLVMNGLAIYLRNRFEKRW